MSFFKHETSVIDTPVTIGKGTKIWHFCHISAGAKIGKACTLGQNVFVGGQVVIGNHVKIQNNVSVYDGVTLEDYVFCGPSMVFTNDLNPRAEYPKHGLFIKTLIKKGATIGANATIVCGVTIGQYAFIGAGSVVTNNLPNFALAYGSPAKQHGWISEQGKKLEFKNNIATCPLSGQRYELQDNTIVIKL